MSNRNKNKNGIVYSTDPDFEYSENSLPAQETSAPASQQLRLWLERGKGGKVATLVRGFVGTDNALEELGKQLKIFCGTGGAVKDGEIMVQGDVREKILAYLVKKGYSAKKAGG